MGFMVVNAITVTNFGPTSIGLTKETFSDEPDVVVTAKLIAKAKGNQTGAPIGDSAPGVEADSTLPLVRNAIANREFLYEFEVKEALANSFQAGENFKIEVYMDDGVSVYLLSTLYMKQDTVNDSAVEGVLIRVSSGSTDVLGDVWSIVITRQ
ncbi:MAG: hypothetical protein V3U90_05470 [Dehalococcoidia bacterium]